LLIQLNNRRLQGYLFAFLAALGYGSASTLGKLALGTVPPILIASYGSIIGGLILFPYKPKTGIERRSLPLFCLVVLCGSIFGPLLFYNGLRMTSAVVAALLSNGELLFTSIIAIAIFGESLNRRQYAASLLVVFGIVAVSTNFELAATALFANLTGSLYILGAMLSWGIENNLVRKLSQRVDSLAMARWRNLAGGLALLVVILVSGQGLTVRSSTVPYIVLSGINAGASGAILAATLAAEPPLEPPGV
jgi:drug/metabolite transporter (DMT)-like permease